MSHSSTSSVEGVPSDTERIDQLEKTVARLERELLEANTEWKAKMGQFQASVSKYVSELSSEVQFVHQLVKGWLPARAAGADGDDGNSKSNSGGKGESETDLITSELLLSLSGPGEDKRKGSEKVEAAASELKAACDERGGQPGADSPAAGEEASSGSKSDAKNVGFLPSYAHASVAAAAAAATPFHPAVMGMPAGFRYVSDGRGGAASTSSGAAPFVPPNYGNMASMVRPGAFPTVHSASGSPMMSAPYRVELLGKRKREDFDYRRSNEQTGVKRRRGKLPQGARDCLMAWLLSHRSRPYPTEEEKAKLVDITGLTPIQINNWFSNARRRILRRSKDGKGASKGTESATDGDGSGDGGGEGPDSPDDDDGRDDGNGADDAMDTEDMELDAAQDSSNDEDVAVSPPRSHSKPSPHATPRAREIQEDGMQLGEVTKPEKVGAA